MLQAANIDLFNPLIPKALKIYYFLYKLSLFIFIFCTLGTNLLTH